MGAVIRAALAALLGTGLVAAPNAYASHGAVEKGVLVYDHREPSQSGVRIFQAQGGIAIDDYQAEAGPGCAHTALELDPETGAGQLVLLCTGAASVAVRGRDRDEGLDLGSWVWERIRVEVSLPATVEGLAGRDMVNHETLPEASDELPIEFSSPVKFDGGVGDDRLESGTGDDTLMGGPGVDVLNAGAGDDRIFARDGEKDAIGCGEGRDTAEADAFDTFHPDPAYGCEIVNGHRVGEKRRPNLRGRFLGDAPRVLNGGEDVQLTIVTANAGRGDARASRTGVYLSRDGRADRRDWLLGRVAAGRVAAGGESLAGLTARVPATRNLRGRRRLLVCADDAHRVRERREGDNCAVGRVRVAVTSSALLGAAVRARRLSPARAAGLEVLALNGDRRLPRRYRGDGGQGEDSATVRAAVAAFGRMPGQLKRQVAPYLLPPTARTSGSVRESASTPCRYVPRSAPFPEWKSKVAAEGRVRIWWKDDRRHRRHRALAARLATELDAKIWRPLTELMGNPATDQFVPCEHGPDGALDVYLTDAPRPDEPTTPSKPAERPLGQGREFPYNCERGRVNPAFIELYPTRNPPLKHGMAQALVHELMHVLQDSQVLSMGCAVPEWINEGIAAWSENYVYPDAKPTTDWFLTDNASAPLDALNGSWRYWSWPWWLAVTHGFDPEGKHNPGAVAQVYDKMRKQSAIEAVEEVIGGFSARWPEFARLGWNQRPQLDKAFFSPGLGKLTDHPSPKPYEATLRGPSPTRVPLFGVPRPALSRHYEQFTFPDRAVRLIETTQLPTDAGYRLLAFYEVAGKWSEYDATKGLRFCRDDAEENISSLILITSNSDPRRRIDPTRAALMLSDRCQDCDFDLDQNEQPIPCVADRAPPRERGGRRL